MNDGCDLNVKICMQVANGALAADFAHFGMDDFPLIFFLSASKSSFFRFGVEIRFWSCKIAAICGAVVRNSIALGNSVSADCSVMVASRWLAAAVASVILLCFASEIRESHCDGCMKVANGALAADIFHFGIDDFPFKIPFKKCFKIVVFPLWRNLWSRCS